MAKRGTIRVDLIFNLIKINQQKYAYLNQYLELNQLIEKANSKTELVKLAEQKKALNQKIERLDEQLLQTISNLKIELGIDDLSELSVKTYPQIKELKKISAKVIEKMADCRQSDKKMM